MERGTGRCQRAESFSFKRGASRGDLQYSTEPVVNTPTIIAILMMMMVGGLYGEGQAVAEVVVVSHVHTYL